jgi:nicotinate-nucleotide--dimethylbenzimidazole phosphoribosyltransferase
MSDGQAIQADEGFQVDEALARAIQKRIDSKTKPLGALGRLESLAHQICMVQQRLDPELNKPVLLVCAGDHGIAAEGVSAYPAEVTHQMVLNYLAGGAAINVFARANGLALHIADAGVNHDFSSTSGLIQAKVRRGTRNFLHEPAMTAAECEQALQKGAELVRGFHREGSNVIGFGEMGIANTSSAAVLASLYRGLPLLQCVGRGTGLDDAGVARKYAVLAQAVENRGALKTPMEVLCAFGGYEIAMIAGGILEAAAQRMLILIDGFIVSAALCAAQAIQVEMRRPDVLPFCIFAHRSEETGHSGLMASLGARPLLDLGMRLGEGTGAALAYPMVKAAVAFMNEMATFESAAVSERK